MCTRTGEGQLEQLARVPSSQHPAHHHRLGSKPSVQRLLKQVTTCSCSLSDSARTQQGQALEPNRSWNLRLLPIQTDCPISCRHPHRNPASGPEETKLLPAPFPPEEESHRVPGARSSRQPGETHIVEAGFLLTTGRICLRRFSCRTVRKREGGGLMGLQFQ